jgi:hypothetical protein
MTSIVLIEGWSDERNPKPVSLVDLLKKHAGLGLAPAKRILDNFAEAGLVRVAFSTVEGAQAFVREGKAMGLRCSIDED